MNCEMLCTDKRRCGQPCAQRNVATYDVDVSHCRPRDVERFGWRTGRMDLCTIHREMIIRRRGRAQYAPRTMTRKQRVRLIAAIHAARKAAAR